MKYVYPGAHHTRYEYVFTQLMLISNIAKSDTCRNVELSLSANLAEYEQLGHSLSGSALMQCLAILSNAGHMYDTFTASRILLRLLKESKEEKTDFYAIYKRNLPKAIRRDFDEVLSAGNYYKLHLFHVIQILQGMCRATKNKNLQTVIPVHIDGLDKLRYDHLLCFKGTVVVKVSPAFQLFKFGLLLCGAFHLTLHIGFLCFNLL